MTWKKVPEPSSVQVDNVVPRAEEQGFAGCLVDPEVQCSTSVEAMTYFTAETSSYDFKMVSAEVRHIYVKR
jgi:hypothetical protein